MRFHSYIFALVKQLICFLKIDYDYSDDYLGRDIDTIDLYIFVINKLWRDLEVEKEDSACSVCTTKDPIEKVQYVLSCHNVRRQIIEEV